LEDPGLNGWILLKLILYKHDEKAWTGLIWLWIEKMAGCCEHDNETSGSLKFREYLLWLTNL
jgi:uncharacterized membrane protein